MESDVEYENEEVDATPARNPKAVFSENLALAREIEKAFVHIVREMKQHQKDPKGLMAYPSWGISLRDILNETKKFRKDYKI